MSECVDVKDYIYVPRAPKSSAKPARQSSSLLTLDSPQFISPRDWLVDGLLETRGSLLIVAEEGVGKSAVAVEMTAAIAGERPFFGQSTESGLVIYIAAEKVRESGRRLRVDVPLDHQRRVRLTARSPFGDERALAAFITDAKTFEQEEGERLALIVIDTAGRAIGDADENSTRDVNRFVAQLDSLRAKTGAAVLLVHHARRAEGRARGSQVFPAWADGVAIVEKTKSGRVMRLIKSNVADEGLAIPFAIEARAIDQDEAAGTVAIAVAAVANASRRMPQKPRISGDQALALTLLPSDGSLVSLYGWRKQCVSEWQKPNAAAARVAWHSLINPKKSRLLQESLITIEGDSVRSLAGVSKPLASVGCEEALGVSSAPSPYGGETALANGPATPGCADD